MPEKREYWGGEEEEILTCTTLDEYLEELHDNIEDGDIPETVTACRYESKELEDWSLREGVVLDDLLERWDEEYGGEDPTESTQAMKDAEKAFLAVMQAEYNVWQCDIVERREVNFREWTAAHV